MLCIIEVQAVLALGDLKNSQARRGAKVLYEALKSQYQMVAFSSQDPSILRMWMRDNHMADWSLIKTWDRDTWSTYTDWAQHEIAQFLAAGWEIGLYIDSYPGITVPVTRMGVPTMQAAYPAVGPGFSDPEKATRAWADVSTVGTNPGGDNGPG